MFQKFHPSVPSLFPATKSHEKDISAPPVQMFRALDKLTNWLLRKIKLHF